MSPVNRPLEPGSRVARLVLVPVISLYAHLKHLIAVSGLRGPVFRRYLLNEQIDQDETWAQEVSARDVNFHNLLL